MNPVNIERNTVIIISILYLPYMGIIKWASLLMKLVYNIMHMIHYVSLFGSPSIFSSTIRYTLDIQKIK